jgi:hypothetical protein
MKRLQNYDSSGWVALLRCDQLRSASSKIRYGEKHEMKWKAFYESVRYNLKVTGSEENLEIILDSVISEDRLVIRSSLNYFIVM